MSSSQSNRIKKPTGPKTSGRAPTTAKGGNAAAFDGEKLGAHKSDALCLGSGWRGKIWPDQPVVVWAQFLAGDNTIGKALNKCGNGRRASAAAIGNVVQLPHRSSPKLRQLMPLFFGQLVEVVFEVHDAITANTVAVVNSIY